jgi:hypothetical protein
VARTLTALFLLLTVLVFTCYVAIFLNPQLFFNPFKPPVVPPVAPPAVAEAAATTAVPTFTPPLEFPPTWTPTLTPVPTETFTPRPTSTPAPPTSTPVPPTSTPRPKQFALREPPLFVSQQLYPGASGWWTGLAGEVSTLSGEPVTDVVVRVVDHQGRTFEVTPGSAGNYAQAYGTTYGGGGSYAWWEQHLEGSCQQSLNVRVQLFRAGQPVTDEVKVKTSGVCATNLVLVHFVKNW